MEPKTPPVWVHYRDADDKCRAARIEGQAGRLPEECDGVTAHVEEVSGRKTYTGVPYDRRAKPGTWHRKGDCR